MTRTALAATPDRYVVGLTADADVGVARERAEDVHRELDFGEFGTAVAGRFSDRALSALENAPNVEYVEADGPVRAVARTVPWGVDRVDADEAHANGETGHGIDIAVVDTGIQPGHPDLYPNLGTGKDFTGFGSWIDDNGHGTHCAGIAGAVGVPQGVVGVATEATLHAVKVLDGTGSGTFSDVAAGIQWVADQGYDVASMSIAGPDSSSTMQNAVRYAQRNGVLQVAAAGTSGSVGYPAAFDEVVAVSAINGNDALASFSASGSAIELAAPGTDVYSTYVDGGYDTLSGTSMACPHVAGAGAQIMANGHSAGAARQRLQDTAEDLGLSSDEQGQGLLDVPAAVNGCVDAGQ